MSEITSTTVHFSMIGLTERLEQAILRESKAEILDVLVDVAILCRDVATHYDISSRARKSADDAKRVAIAAYGVDHSLALSIAGAVLRDTPARSVETGLLLRS